MSIMPLPLVISIFAGCGGSSLGYKLAGFKELLAIDFEKNAVETFALNFPDVPVWQKDIKEVTGKEIMDFCKLKKGELDVFDGSPPCQGFSTAGKRNLNDSRNDLFKEYCRLVKELQPKVFVMENVSGMIKGTMKGKFLEIFAELKACGYNVKCKLMNAMWYDVPQSRERLIFIGVRKGFDVEITFPSINKKFITCKQAIGDLPVGEKGKHALQVINAWYKSKPGQALRDAVSYVGCFQSCRLDPNKVSPTLIKSHRHWHYLVPRQLSDRELLRICSYPDSFNLLGTNQEKKNRVGNSVPPLMMKAIALHIKENILSKINA